MKNNTFLLFLIYFLSLPLYLLGDYSKFEESPDDRSCWDYTDAIDPEGNKRFSTSRMNSHLTPDNKVRVCQVEWTQDKRRHSNLFPVYLSGRHG